LGDNDSRHHLVALFEWGFFDFFGTKTTLLVQLHIFFMLANTIETIASLILKGRM